MSSGPEAVEVLLRGELGVLALVVLGLDLHVDDHPQLEVVEVGDRHAELQASEQVDAGRELSVYRPCPFFGELVVALVMFQSSCSAGSVS